MALTYSRRSPIYSANTSPAHDFKEDLKPEISHEEDSKAYHNA